MSCNNALIERLLEFADAGVSPYHVVEKLRNTLKKSGFECLDRKEQWELKSGGKYFVEVNGSALFAFIVGKDKPENSGFRIVSAHTDSPTLKIKPGGEIQGGACLRLNTEVYGGPILSTWFDRPLTLAGRVFLKTDNALKPECRLLHIDRPLLMIPNLAIHLDRTVNDAGHPIKRQKELLPILCAIQDGLEQNNALMHLISQELGVKESEILDFDLSLCGHERACTWGLNNDFLSARGLDDLAMAHAGLEAICEAEPMDYTAVLALFDNEEVGSGTKQGAGSPVFSNLIKRMVMTLGGDEESYCRALAHSFMISADMAHALHPNYPEKHDPVNHPKMNGGPVIKINANQKYITDGESAAVFKSLCAKAGVPYQEFVNHSDVAGGSTLGNVLLGQMDIKGVDVGNPMWGMHSVYETVGVEDCQMMVQVIRTFFK